MLKRQYISISLGMAVLLETLMPPAHLHAHCGGEIPHSHSHACDVDAHHDATCRHHDHQAIISDNNWSPGSTVLAAAACHAHVSFLLFDLTWPVPSDDRWPPLDENGGAALLSSTRTGIAFPVLLTIHWVHGELALEAAVGALGNLSQSGSQLPPDSAAIRSCLCDTARHERSGAQLF